MLTREDLITLSNADPETKKIDYANKLVAIDTESVVRLADAGYCDAKGNLSEKGIAAFGKLQTKIGQLKKGVPFEDRKNADHNRLVDSPHPWRTGQLKKKDYMTDGFFFIYTKPQRSLESKKGSAELRKKMPIIINKVIAMDDMVEVFPHTWQIQSFGGVELIWLADKREKTFVPVQTSYFDFVKFKYPSTRFFAKTANEKAPIHCRVQKRGLDKDVAAILMPMEPDDSIPIPKKRGG